MFHHQHSVTVALLVAMSAIILIKPGIAGNTADEEKATLYAGKFSDSRLDDWKHKSFDGETRYELVTDVISSQPHTVLKASSSNAASGLFREIRVNLEKTPWLHWSWKSEKPYSNINESEKSGDDFIARIYVIINGGIFFWNTRSLTYVWSSSHQTGEAWPSPYTSNATMLAVESGGARLGQWQHYKRNVREDFRRLTGKDVRHIDAVAIMTDSDNTGQKATTYYGDIFFTSE